MPAPRPRRATSPTSRARANRPAFSGMVTRKRPSRGALAVGRLHHAWLIGGPAGIGKATLAYRVARRLVADPRTLPSPDSLDVPEDHPAARQVTALSHPNLVALRRVQAPGAKTLPTRISVDAAREALALFGATAGGGGRLAGLHRRQRRGSERQQRQRAPEDDRGAAAPRHLPHRLPRAGPPAADDSLALPGPDAACAAGGGRARDHRRISGALRPARRGGSGAGRIALRGLGRPRGGASRPRHRRGRGGSLGPSRRPARAGRAARAQAGRNPCRPRRRTSACHRSRRDPAPRRHRDRSAARGRAGPAAGAGGGRRAHRVLGPRGRDLQSRPPAAGARGLS
ncbi:protein of unknown function [Methylorubrum extorquens]|uniref:Uncharacterized protein n=1 Tax=Methylorubrum extorquens TaxID=408 RepID=A0A2N9AKG7_METEX|nr:protein of unknown function [Methylorubrum extorquens]